MSIYIGGVQLCNKDEGNNQPVRSKNFGCYHIHGRKKMATAAFMGKRSYVTRLFSISNYTPEISYK